MENIYINEEWYLIIKQPTMYWMEIVLEEKKYKVNKQGLFEEIKD